MTFQSMTATYLLSVDRSRTYNIFLAIGGILPMLGGSLLGLFSYPEVFFELELGGTVFLFLGFVLSARYMAGREAARAAKAFSSP